MPRKHHNPDVTTPVVVVVSVAVGAALANRVLRPSSTPAVVTERQSLATAPPLGAIVGGVRDDLPTGNGQCPPGTSWGWGTNGRGGHAYCRPIEPESTP